MLTQKLLALLASRVGTCQHYNAFLLLPEVTVVGDSYTNVRSGPGTRYDPGGVALGSKVALSKAVKMQAACSVTLSKGLHQPGLHFPYTHTHQVLTLNFPPEMLAFHHQYECRVSSPKCPATVWSLNYAYETANTI